MSYALQVVILFAAGLAGMCGVSRLGDRQQRTLEARCACLCTRVSTDDPDILQRWLAGDPTLTGAWGGGLWQCGR